MSRFRCEGGGRLQEVSSNTEETTKSGSGASNGLVTGTGESGGLSGGWDNNGANWGGGWGDNWDDSSGVRVRASKKLADTLKKLCWKQYGVPGAAVHYGGDSWLIADSAWAVGDGDCLRL